MSSISKLLSITCRPRAAIPTPVQPQPVQARVPSATLPPASRVYPQEIRYGFKTEFILRLMIELIISEIHFKAVRLQVLQQLLNVSMHFNALLHLQIVSGRTPHVSGV